jgi:hypothetical protein
MKRKTMDCESMERKTMDCESMERKSTDRKTIERESTERKTMKWENPRYVLKLLEEKEPSCLYLLDDEVRLSMTGNDWERYNLTKDLHDLLDVLGQRNMITMNLRSTMVARGNNIPGTCTIRDVIENEHLVDINSVMFRVITDKPFEDCKDWINGWLYYLGKGLYPKRSDYVSFFDLTKKKMRLKIDKYSSLSALIDIDIHIPWILLKYSTLGYNIDLVLNELGEKVKQTTLELINLCRVYTRKEILKIAFIY